MNQELKNLILTYNAIMAGQSIADENEISEKILKLADKLGDCGCKQRRDFLNTKFPFHKNK